MKSRLPLLNPAGLETEQKELYDSILQSEILWTEAAGCKAITSDGCLLGPFNPVLFHPQLGKTLLELFRVEKQTSSLTDREHEIIVLTVGNLLYCAYEIYAHIAIGKKAGLSTSEIDALVNGAAGKFQTEREDFVHQFTIELVSKHRVADGLYKKGASLFDNKTLLQVTILIGLYLTVCSILNAFEVEVP
jgi:4-carboxymuconolactone decarboxylase